MVTNGSRAAKRVKRTRSRDHLLTARSARMKVQGLSGLYCSTVWKTKRPMALHQRMMATVKVMDKRRCLTLL